MKTTKNILFASIIIIGLTVPKDVFVFAFHLPGFIHHFQEHKNEHRHMPFWDFMAEHATTPDHGHRDNRGHDDLPFGSQQSTDSNQFSTYFTLCTKDIFNFHFLSSIKKKISSSQFSHHSCYIRSIWQPPKIS